MKRFTIIQIFAVLCAVYPAVFLASCSKLMGYSVVLWADPEKNLADGDIVPVFIKSNISHTYVVSADAQNMDNKIEVPLWQLTEPLPRRQAEKEAERYAEYRNQYARVATDGLPIRADADSVGRQVYRLRRDEIIKVLYKGTGSKVMSGQNELPGEWLRVLTSDGTEGWCYSYNLRLFDITEDQTIVETTENEEDILAKDTLLQTVLASQWYPEEYADGNRDILYPKWTKGNYKGGEEEYSRLDRARKIDKEAADASASPQPRHSVVSYRNRHCIPPYPPLLSLLFSHRPLPLLSA